MRKLTDNQWEVLMHWLLTLVGGFMGTYAVLLHAGNFGSAQTGNIMEMAADLVSMEWSKVLLRLIAFIIFGFGVHTHLVESIWEAEEALRCFPGYHSDAEIYERAGLMDHGPSIFAHVIFPTEEDKRIMKKHGSFSVHCPDATTNIIAGIMPLAAMHDEELKIAIGSDVAGGHSIAIYKQIARAVQLSKLKEFYEPDQSQTITLTQAFYHATKEAGSVFGKVGSFEKGYQFNALVIDTMEDSWVPLTAEERLERFCYIGDDRNIRARFIDGKEIHFEN